MIGNPVTVVSCRLSFPPERVLSDFLSEQPEMRVTTRIDLLRLSAVDQGGKTKNRSYAESVQTWSVAYSNRMSSR